VCVYSLSYPERRALESIILSSVVESIILSSVVESIVLLSVVEIIILLPVACSPLSYSATLSHKRHILRKNLLNIKFVF
jgi:hypothetical protein